MEFLADFRFLSSLEKVFPVPELSAKEIAEGKALQGEVFSFQLASLLKSEVGRWRASVTAEGPLAKYVTIRSVRNMPSERPAPKENDPGLLNGAKPGLYPDLLYPLEQDHLFVLLHAGWTSLWVTVRIPEQFPGGVYEIPFRIVSMQDNPVVPDDHFERTFTYRLEVLPQKLPEQKLKHIEWFHADCVYVKHHVPCWSEEHWSLLERYFRNMVDHGINMLYVPLWTPPLDTAIGTERPTVQLLEVEKAGENFLFDFRRLERYLNLALNCGMKYFEFSHAFTQWGAKATPKIMVRVGGKEEKYFGWHVPATSPEYTVFLKQLMGELLPLLRDMELNGKCYFAVSDEPQKEHLESYGFASGLMEEILGDFPTLDALSEVEFLETGLVRNPIPMMHKIEGFRGKVKELWTYYCCSPQVTNRFFAFPSVRVRLLGVLLWIYEVKGFLQWGYNFWYSNCSLDTKINVFANTDANRTFPSGDAFLVYPGEDGPLDSLRGELIREAMQDMRLLDLVEKKIGRDAVMRMICDGVEKPVTMTEAPCSAEWLLDLRRRLLTVL